MEMTRVERVKQCQMESSPIQLGDHPVDGLVRAAHYGLNWSPKFAQSLVTGCQILRVRVRNEEVRKRPAPLLRHCPGRQWASVRKGRSVFDLYPASARKEVNVRSLGGEFLTCSPRRINIP